MKPNPAHQKHGHDHLPSAVPSLVHGKGSDDMEHHQVNWMVLQLLLIRVYIGLDFTHHFAEKFGLLGVEAQQNVTHYFSTVSGSPQQMVLLAGLCEFGAFIGFTCGLFTRVAAFGAALYLVIALFMGSHHLLGFTWANPGGGWEYPALWAFICFSYVLTGGGRYSLDHFLHQKMPKSLRWLSA